MLITGAEFVKLLTENYSKIYGYIIRLLPCYDVAEDIMQETTTSMWEQRKNFKVNSNFVAWGCSIAHYKILDYRYFQKRDRKIIFNEDVLKLIEEAMPTEENIGNAYLHKLQQCLTKLKENDLNLIRLRYWKSIRVADISKQLNISLRSVYYNLSRIQGRLLICVKRDEA